MGLHLGLNWDYIWDYFSHFEKKIHICEHSFANITIVIFQYQRNLGGYPRGEIKWDYGWDYGTKLGLHLGLVKIGGTTFGTTLGLQVGLHHD